MGRGWIMEYFVDKNKGNMIGRRLELLIFAKGFRSIRSFAEYMKVNCPEEYVSDDTISNTIKGKNVSKSTLITTAKTLGVPIEMLISENIVMFDEYLEYWVQPLLDEYNSIVSGMVYTQCDEVGEVAYIESTIEEFDKRFAKLDLFKDVLFVYDLSVCFYPSTYSDDINLNHPIKTLGELLIYFPICDMRVFSDVVYRIAGEINNYEQYILKQIEYLYKRIPSTPAKRYADYLVLTSRLEKKAVLSAEESRLKEKLSKYEMSRDCDEGYKQYYSAMEYNYNYFHDWQYDSLLKYRHDSKENLRRFISSLDDK